MCDEWDDVGDVQVPAQTFHQQPSFKSNTNWGNSKSNDDWGDSPSSSFQSNRRDNRKNDWGNRNSSRSNDDWGDSKSSSFQSNRRDNRNKSNDDWGDSSSSSNRRDNWKGSNNRDGGGGGGNRQFRREEEGEGETIKVPSARVGKIIGRGGSKIAELEQSSGARIKVTKETEGDLTMVKLFGGEAAIKEAKSLILELTTDQPEAPPKPSYQAAVPEEPKPTMDFSTWLANCEKREAAQWAKYPPIKKDFYREHPEVTRMSEAEVADFREANNNIVVGRTFDNPDSRPIPKPATTFVQAFHEYPEILEEIRKVGFEKPSPIQAQAWPVLMSGEDLIGIAQTGTGKTLAFLLPALIHIEGQGMTTEERGGPACLIMAPTRELALQIDREVKKYKYKNINSVCIYGGGSRRDQIREVTNGVDIVIATPGRLNDIVCSGSLDVKPVTYVVLDEADRMLDMGFEPQIRKVMYTIRPTRHTIMTSATWPPGVRRLANSYMKDPIQVYVGSLDLAATHTVTQTIMMLKDDDEKKQVFKEFAFNLNPEEKVIVFCGKKARADDLSSELSVEGLSCQALHGDLDQADREQALIDIRSGDVQILIATDLASRGLDIEDITHVVNFDFPRNIEEYVHRVGRTGRAGRSGESISYFTRADWGSAKDLIAILEEAQQFVPGELHSMAERYKGWKERKDADGPSRRGGFGGGGGGRGRRF